eukprot:10784794-Alexandrium_andersonii.AAC.1
MEGLRPGARGGQEIPRPVPIREPPPPRGTPAEPVSIPAFVQRAPGAPVEGGAQLAEKGGGEAGGKGGEE